MTWVTEGAAPLLRVKCPFAGTDHPRDTAGRGHGDVTTRKVTALAMDGGRGIRIAANDLSQGLV